MGTTIAPPVPQAPAASTPAPGTPAAAPPAGTPAASAPAAPRPAAPAPEGVSTNEIIGAMLKAAKNTSDLIFSPGKAPQVEVNGQLLQVQIPRVGTLSAQSTARIAADLIGKNAEAVRKLREQGSCDLSYSLPGISRFRVNVFMQRGSYAIVMRVIPNAVPGFNALKLPEQLMEICDLRNGIVLVTGPTGSGKSSTLAAVLDRVNETKAYHIVTIEDPIEFLHAHKKGTIHQRELYSDTPTFALALRAALRQAPKVILVGEMRDRETIEIALEAAETGHLVLSTLHTIDASKTVERIVGVFPLSDQHAVRTRFAKAFRFIISQRLIPKKDGTGRLAIVEILKSTQRTREYVEKGETEGKSLLDAMRDGSNEGMQHFDGELERLMRSGELDMENAMSYASNPGNLRLQIADLLEEKRERPRGFAAKETLGGPGGLEIER